MLFTKKDNPDVIFSRIIPELQTGVKDADHPFHFMILATSGPAGPAVRYVVLRDVDTSDSLELITYTDKRTAKVQQIAGNNLVSVLFWHPAKKCQVRMKCAAFIHRNDSLSDSHWQRIGGNALKSYTQQVPPGQPLNGPEEAHSWNEGHTDHHFTLLRIQPEYLDVLQLNAAEHLRVGITRTSEGWNAGWLAP